MRNKRRRNGIARNRRRSPQRKRVESRSLFPEQLEDRLLLAGDAFFPWHNIFVATDVSGDLTTTPRDALLIINELNEHGIRELQSDAGYGGDGNNEVFLDTHPDHFITPMDALRVINSLNNPEGEGLAKRVSFQLEAAELDGTPLPTRDGMPQVLVGDDFALTMTVQDIRPEKTDGDGLVSGEFATGVFSAFADIGFDAASLFEVTMTPPEGISDVYIPSHWYNNLPEAHWWDEDVDGDSQPDEFDETGGYLLWNYALPPNSGGTGGPDIDGDDIPDPGDVYPVGTFNLGALDTGVLTFETNDAELSEHDIFLLYTPDDVEEPEEVIDYGMLMVDIVDWVNAVDDVYPVAPDQILEDSSVLLDVLANDFLAEKSTGTLALAGVNQPAHGTVSKSSGQVLYTPDPNFFGTDTFHYTARDGNGNTSVARVTVTVTNVNDAPVAIGDPVTVAEDSGVSFFTVTDNDNPGPNEEAVDSVALLDIATQPAHGVAQVIGDQVRYAPNADYYGTDSFTYTIEDEGGLTDTATVTVTVEAVNDPPVAEDDDYNVQEDSEDNLIVVTGNDLPGPSNENSPVDSVSVKEIKVQATNGTAEVIGSEVQYTPNANFFGTDTFVYTVEDEGGLTDTATVTVNIESVNDAPLAEDDPAVVDELTQDNVIDVISNDLPGPPPESEAIRIINVVRSGPDEGGAISISGDNQSLIYTPEDGKLGPYNEVFTYTISDVDGLTDTATVTIEVVPAIRPRARDDSFAVNEDSVLADNVIAVTANDLFNDGATVLPIVIGDGVNGLLQPSHGTIEVFEEFSVRYQPDPDFFGTDTFEYQVDDDFVGDEGASAPDVGLVTVTVVNVNDDPIADDDAATIQEDSGVNVIDVTANDLTGPSNEAPPVDSVTVVAITTPADNGFAEVVSGEVRYTPNQDFFGEDSFTYSIQDEGGLTDTATVTVTVEGVNDAPVAQDDAANVLEDSGVNVITVLSNDNPGPNENAVDSISVTGIAVQALNGTAAVVGGEVRYTPDDEFFGEDTFTYTITDEGELTETATVTVTVAAVNDKPMAMNDTATVQEDSTNNVVNVLTNDTPGPDNEASPVDSIVVTEITDQAANGTATVVGGQVRYTPATNYFGTDTFTYTITDEGGLTDTATVTVTVESVNDAPIADDDFPVVDELTENNVLDVLANDLPGPAPESEAIQIIDVVRTGPDEGGTISIASDGLSLIYTPEANKLGPFTEAFTYTIEDAGGLTDTATVTIDVLVPIRPAARDDRYTVDEDSALADNVLPVIDNDLFNDGATVAPIVIGDGANELLQPAHGTIDILDDFSIRYQPDPDFFGVDTFEYQIDDDFSGDDGASVPDVGLVTVTVTNINDAPIADNDIATIQEDSEANTIDVLANDSPGPNEESVDSVSVLNIATQAADGEAKVVNGEVQYTPNQDFFGTDTFTYTIQDDSGLTDTAMVTVTVTDVNDDPVAQNDDYVVLEDSNANVLDVMDNDNSGPNENEVDSIRVISILEPATNGEVNIVGGEVQYSPNGDFFGTDSFTYVIEDEGGLTDTAQVSITVENVNDAPTAVPDVGDAQLLALKNFDDQVLDVLVNDTFAPDVDEELTIVGLGPSEIAQQIPTSEGGTIKISADGKSVIYTPANDFTGIDTFSYTISDGNGLTSSTVAEIDVVDAVPSTISGYAFMDVNDNGLKDPQEIGLSGVKITLKGTNIRGTEVNETVVTDADGIYTFESVLPNAVDDLVGYSISEATPMYLIDGTDYISDTSAGEDLVPGQAYNDIIVGIRPGLFGSNGRTEMNYHFGERGVTGEYISIAQYLASSNPGMALATSMSGDDYWYTVLRGWEGVQSAHVQLADDLTSATLTITDSEGNEQTQTISYEHYRLAGDSDTGEYIIYFNGTAEDLGFDLAAAEGEAENAAPFDGDPVEMIAQGGAQGFAEDVDQIFGQDGWA